MGVQCVRVLKGVLWSWCNCSVRMFPSVSWKSSPDNFWEKMKSLPAENLIQMRWMRCGALCIKLYTWSYTHAISYLVEPYLKRNAIKKDFYMMGTGVLFLYNSYFFVNSPKLPCHVPRSGGYRVIQILLSMWFYSRCSGYSVHAMCIR